MRYSLRNKEKLSKTFGISVLNDILKVLDLSFKNNNIEIINDDKFKYPVINLKNSNFKCEFFIISTKYDVLNLAYKNHTYEI